MTSTARSRRTRVAILGRIMIIGVSLMTIALMLLSIPSIRSVGITLMASAGLTRDGLTRSVTEQALKGIFHYMANEEAALRRNPGRLLKGIF